MEPLYFRVTGAPDDAEFDRHWVTLVPARFVVDRSVVRSAAVSRAQARCVLLRPDHDEGCWQLSNRAQGRLLVAYNGQQRYELPCDMSVWLRDGAWTGSLTDAFSFAVTTRRPVGIVRSAPETVDGDAPVATLRRGPRDERAAAYLDRHRFKRLVLAHWWRRHIGHTPGTPEDLEPAAVGRDFGVTDKVVITYRSDLAKHVWEATGHQHAIRDLVLKGGLLTWTDVVEADREIVRRRTES